MSNDQTRDKPKKDNPVGTKTYKSTMSINMSIPETKIIISGLITRADEEILASKVNEVNAMLKQSCLGKN